MMLLKRLMACIFALCATHAPATAQQKVLALEDIFASVWTDYPDCDRIATHGLTLEIQSAIFGFVSDPAIVKAYVNTAILVMDYWPEDIPCFREPFTGQVTVHVRNRKLGGARFSHTAEVRSASFQSFEVLEQDYDTSGIWKVVSDIQRGRYGKSYEPDLDKALPALDKAATGDAGPAWLYDYIKGRLLILATKKSTQREGLAHLARASEAGSSSATLALLRYERFDGPISRIANSARAMRNGVTTTLPPYASRVFSKNETLLRRALAQNVGEAVSLEHALNEVGVHVTPAGLEQTATPMPMRRNVDDGLHTYLSGLIRTGAFATDAFWRTYSADMPLEVASMECDDDWCFAVNKLIKFRMSPLDDPSCEMSGETLAICDFEWRFVFASNYIRADDPQWALFREFSGPSERFPGQAEFRLEAGKWVMVPSSVSLDKN